MSDGRLHDDSGEAEAVKGVVLVDGPDGVALTLTAKAAATMSRQLARSATEAEAQARNLSASRDIAETDES